VPELGIWFDLRNPPQWRQDPARLHAFTLEACEEAERLGVASIWVSEHHLFDDGYLAQPLTFAAAIAARTSRPRIGTAVAIAPLHHPAELAEQAALVDLVSAGRLDLGIGTGYREPEFALFDASLDRRYAQTDGCAKALRELWSRVTPAPVQQPLPIWMGYQGPQGARRAGLLGEGLLTADGASWQPYREGLAAAGHDLAVARMAGGVNGWVSDDPDRDWSWVGPYAAYQFNSYRRYMVEGTGRPVPRTIGPDEMRDRARSGPLGSFLYDTPEGAAARIRAHIGEAPVETVYLWASLGGMPEAAVIANIQTLCAKLAPLLREPATNSDIR
jgi:alkanesulfonate monooxygenase SsuD/methylene tetrahydromethanopterin reductase-like flavin-dependent oxidoreductase (luciferase family)